MSQGRTEEAHAFLVKYRELIGSLLTRAARLTLNAALACRREQQPPVGTGKARAGRDDGRNSTRRY
jgi:hypothetical protein